MEAVSVRFITRAETVPLRRARLNPDLTPEEAERKAQGHPNAFQCGTFVGNTLLSVVTFHPEAVPHHPEGLLPPPFVTPWRLRALATAPGQEGKGLARQAIAFGLDHLYRTATPGETGVWLYGRETAYGFYDRLGFSRAGICFTTDTGPHDLFWICGPLE